MSETLGRTAEIFAVSATVVALVGGVALVGYASVRPHHAVPAAAAPPQSAERHEFSLTGYGQPTIIDCDSPDPAKRQFELSLIPERAPQVVVIGAKRLGAVAEAARLQIGPPDSDVGFQDWRHGPAYGDRIPISEYQTPEGARRNLGTVASILVQAADQTHINLTATCD